MTTIRFNDALRLAASALQRLALPAAPPPRVIRDVYGRLRFALDCALADYPPAALAELQQAQQALGAYATSQDVLTRDSFSNPDAVFGSPDWHRTTVSLGVDEDGEPLGETEVLLLDRQVVGQDWLRTSRFLEQGQHPPRVVFYGLKGGVGRSTALAMLAYRLARDGRRVLLIDFDLESPGLSGLLLPPDRVAPCGLVDWFVEDAVGQGDVVLRDLLSVSPLADQTPGAIHIAAAMGQGETAYLSKLARVYADVPSKDGPQTFADRLLRVTHLLEAQERPDIVLIDSRAGLHDVAAVTIGSLATVALLFATDSPQNWQGYRQLFRHWQQRPDVLRQVRERMVMVQALFPEADQAERARSFVQNAWALFSELVYDQLEPGAEVSEDAFSFDLHNEEAPHFPLRVRWNARFQEFDPLLGRSTGGVDAIDIDLAFGPFVQDVVAMLPEPTHD